MVAISGMAVQSMFFGNTTGPEMWLPGAAFENELGVQPPVGFWDPLGFTKDGNVDNFRRRRAVELKHGRLSMFAAVGYIVPEYYKWPGYISPSQEIKFEDIPHGLGAITKVPILGWLQIGLFIGPYEGYLMRQDPNRPPGDFFRFGFLGTGILGGPYNITDPEAKKQKLAAELANGRLAMFAIMAMLFQNGTVGTTGPEMWLPPSAFENELGVQPPTGFWDPLGFTKDGSVENFRRRRAVELKHGRLAMFAATGYIVPEYYKWPGYISPSQDLKFEDIPHGLAAITKVPILGWLQIGLFIGHYEGYLMRQDPKRPPGDFFRFGFLGTGILGGPYNITDPEAKKTKLAAELANGRLAMFAIMAMMFQNGYVGTTGPDMWLPPSAFENELGVQAPVGLWDPLGFTK